MHVHTPGEFSKSAAKVDFNPRCHQEDHIALKGGGRTGGGGGGGGRRGRRKGFQIKAMKGISNFFYG
jgi:hypothetical protein